MAKSSVSRRGLLGGTASGVLVPAMFTAPPASAEDASPSRRTPATSTERASAQVDVVLQVNGSRLPLTVEPRTSLLDALREQAELTGTKKGCDRGS